jgi:diguanylate cyclase (GGDEF)-like protein
LVEKTSKFKQQASDFNPHDLAAEQLRHVYRGVRSGAIIVFFTGAVIAAILAWDIGAQYATAWYALLLLAHVLHWQKSRLNWSSANMSAELANINQHIIAAGLAGLGWGAMAFILPWLERPNQSAILIVMMVIVIIAMPRLVVSLPIFFAFAAGVYVPLILVIPFLDAETQYMVAVMLLVIFASLWASASEIRRIIIEVLLKQISSEQASWVDRLTGIGNRRCFDEKIDTAWRQALRNKAPLSLMMVDVDHFKKFNDQYGHQAGDRCLQQIAAALDGCARRASDTVCRYGGEEFAVVLLHTPMNDARNISYKMLAAVSAMAIKHEASVHRIATISIGGATIMPTAASSIEELIEQADKCLYRAKENGRNRAEWTMLPAAYTEKQL